MAKRISLREFQQDLARRLGESRSAPRRPALLAVIAGREHWLVDLSDAGEILAPPPLSEVPLTQTWFRGLANVRGTLYSVVDFAAFCGSPPTPLANECRLMLIGARSGHNTALLVSRALGLRNPEDFEPDEAADRGQPWVSACYRDSQGRLWKRLQVRPLLADGRFLNAGLEVA